jgi:hypothetical protein
MIVQQAHAAATFMYYYPEQATWWMDLELVPFYTTPDLANMFIAKNCEYTTFVYCHRNKVAPVDRMIHDHFGLEYESKYHMKKGLALAAVAHPEKFAAVFRGVDDAPSAFVHDIVESLVLRMMCVKNREEQKRLTAEHKAAIRKIKAV